MYVYTHTHTQAYIHINYISIHTHQLQRENLKLQYQTWYRNSTYHQGFLHFEFDVMIGWNLRIFYLGDGMSVFCVWRGVIQILITSRTAQTTIISILGSAISGSSHFYKTEFSSPLMFQWGHVTSWPVRCERK